MAKKEALRELQSRLAERLQAARTQTRGRSWLAVESAARGFLFPLKEAGEIFAMAPLVPGLELSHVSACDRIGCPGTHNLQPTGRGVVDLVTITVNGYPFTSMVPFAMPSINFGPISATMSQPL